MLAASIARLDRPAISSGPCLDRPALPHASRNELNLRLGEALGAAEAVDVLTAHIEHLGYFCGPDKVMRHRRNGT
jgi:hypothetical protein